MSAEVNDAAVYKELNFEQISTAPDGRSIYDDIERFELSLTNTSKGSSTIISLDVKKSFYSDHGSYDLAMAYTHQDSN